MNQNTIRFVDLDIEGELNKQKEEAQKEEEKKTEKKQNIPQAARVS